MANKITIGFNFENEFGDKYSQSSTVEVFVDFGETDLSVIGEQFNCFLKQCGYIRNNDYILMQDVTEDELEALEDYLCELRKEEE